MSLALVVIVALFAVWWWTRTQELFCISVRGARALVVRGRVPGTLVTELADAVRRSGARSSTIRAMKTERGGRLVASGVGDGTLQQLRNIFGSYPMSRLRQAPAIERPTLGQIAGITWLAWLFDGLFRRR